MKSNPVTLKDIAKQLGITVATVSRALKDYPDISQSTKEAVLKLAKELKYRPNPIALNLRKNRSNTIGVIIPEIVHDFFSKVISGILETADAAGYSVMLCATNESYQREVREAGALMASRVDGLLISLSNGTKDFVHLQEFLDYGIPVVMVDKVSEILPVSKVIVDDFEGAFQAVSHLIAQGCKRIAHFKGREAASNILCRYQGYLEALKTHQIPFDASLVYVCERMNFEDGVALAQQMLQETILPDGIFAGSEMSALGALVTLKAAGVKIPGQVAIVGFNDWKMAAFIEPPLTAVYQPGEAMGRLATEILLEEINLHQKEKPITHRTEVLPTELIVRASSLKSDKEI